MHFSCTLLKKDRTSLFRNEIFKWNKGRLISTNPSLTNLTLSDLYLPKIDTLTKKIDKSHLLHDVIFPVYHLKKVAFLCLTPQILNIDGKMKLCSMSALAFKRQPILMKLNKGIVLDNLRNKPANHLSKQIKWSFASLELNYAPNSLFSQKYFPNAC